MTEPCRKENPTMHRADWVTLRDYVDARFESLYAERIKSDEVLNVRLAAMNEFRASLTDQARSFITREEANLKHRGLEEEARLSRDFRSVHQGKASQGQLWFVSIISVIGVLLGLFHLFAK